MGLWIATGGVALAAVCDARTGRIPNLLSYSVIVAGLPFAAAAQSPEATGGVLAMTIAAVVALYSRGLLGGGDAKLLVGLTMLEGYTNMACTLFYTIMIGGAAAVIVLARHGQLRDAARAAFTVTRQSTPAPAVALPFAVFLLAGHLLALAGGPRWW